MNLTQFAMVEELASLIRDNLQCKYLVLSVEEALVNFLRDDTSSDGILELEPMNSYNRLLLHRLADIFGFSHQSVGEGDDRHLVLQRCPETSIPSVLVSDLLWEYDELQSPRMLEVLVKQRGDSHGLNTETPLFEFSLEDREAAYLQARERIFSVDNYEIREPVKQRPQNNPIVARRMITHALGQQIKPSHNEVSASYSKELEELADNMKIQDDEEGTSNLSRQTCQERKTMPDKHLNSCGKGKVNKIDVCESSYSGTKLPQEKFDRTSTKLGSSGTERKEVDIQKAREEHMGAAKRMFANALRLNSRSGNLSKSSHKK